MFSRTCVSCQIISDNHTTTILNEAEEFDKLLMSSNTKDTRPTQSAAEEAKYVADILSNSLCHKYMLSKEKNCLPAAVDVKRYIQDHQLG